MQPVSAIELPILQRINDIEAGQPENHRETEADRNRKLAQIDGRLHGREPGADRRDGQSETEKKMRCPGEALGE